MPQPVDPCSLPLEKKAALLSGRDFWSTEEVEEAGIPSIVLTDGPHGVRMQTGGSDHLGINDSVPATCFPPAVAVGSSWNPDVAARIGAAIGREGRALGVSVVLGPGVNIKRSPLCGRNFEYYSEDPLLSGVLGAAHVRAMQEEGPGASVKHFAANNQETDRMRVSADVDERTLREIYLPAFERVVKEADPATVMCSYNRINGVHASQNRWLLTEVLREEWGFGGLVVSDWGAVVDRVAALEAGLDLEMPASGGAGDRRVVEAVRAGELGEEVVDRSVRRIAALAELPKEEGEFDAEAHHRLAREAAAECAVLLRNESAALPLDGSGRLAVIGVFAEAPRYQGAGSSRVNPTRLDSALEAVREAAAEYGQEVVYEPGFTLDGSGGAEELRRAAVEAAAGADTAVVFAGLGDEQESEGFDRDHIDLPAEQVELIRAVAAAAPRTVVVLSNGGVVSLEGWHDEVDAILEGWLLGQAGGSALADLLYGRANPSGRLAESIPLRLEDNPSYINFPGEAGHVRHGEGVMVGYRYYETVKRAVRYPFGHGLSYTAFETGELEVEATGPDTARVRVTVANTGQRAGAHVVQVYVSTAAGPVRRPVRELRAFAKVALEPGESRRVELELDRRAFAYYDVEASRWVVAPGEYLVQVGESAAVVVAEQVLVLEGEERRLPLTVDSTLGEWFAHPEAGSVLVEMMGSLLGGEAELGEEMLMMVSSMPMRQALAFAGDTVPQAELDRILALGRGGA